MVIEITVIHGSALSGNDPRDIDVVFTGRWTPAREKKVCDWVAERGLDLGLPLDLVEQVGDRVTIPVVGEENPLFFVLEGEEDVAERRLSFNHVRSFPSALRAAAKGADLAKLLAEPANQRVSLLPPGEAYLNYATIVPGWDKYVCAMTALRNAARKADQAGVDWRSQIACPELIDRLLTEDPTNWKAYPYWPEGRNWGQGWSAAGTLLVRPAGEDAGFDSYVGGEFNHLTEERAIELIFG